MAAGEKALARLEREVPGCAECPRLADFLAGLRTRHPSYWNRPVPGFGDRGAWLVIVGLAPGLHGANRSGRPFFMDASGEWLYGELGRRGLWDGERLRGAYIVNAVKCVPPGNRPSTDEQLRCQPWLVRELEARYRDYVEVTDRVLEGADGHDPGPYFKELLPRFYELKRVIRKISDLNQSTMEEADKQTRKLARSSMQLALTASALTLGLALTLALL